MALTQHSPNPRNRCQNRTRKKTGGGGTTNSQANGQAVGRRAAPHSSWGFSGRRQSIGSSPAASSALLTFENGLVPKNLSSENGDGWADLTITCRVASMSG